MKSYNKMLLAYIVLSKNVKISRVVSVAMCVPLFLSP